MATEHVKVYEDGKKGGVPVWAWLIPLLLILALLAWFLLRRHQPAQTAAPAVVPAATTPVGAMPNLGAVHFATDQATLTQDDQATLTQAAAYMKDHPNTHIRLEGYTDSTGTDEHNLSLSQRRNQSVAQFLKGQGVNSSQITGEGFGPENPKDTNATAAGKADNRRVELFETH